VRLAERQGRGPVDGVLLFNKPGGITSQAAVSRLKMLLAARKAGHTGTLDPLAHGLLPVCFGEATKFSQLLLDADKSYLAVIRLGTRTTTGDLEGAVIERRAPSADEALVRSVLKRFEGELMQMPPMFSALKRDGRPLYEYARAGQEVSREPRRIHVRRLTLERYSDEDLFISVTCTKGTYIRVLAEDIGRALECGACLAALTRTAVGAFRLADAVTFEQLERMALDDRQALLLPVDALVGVLPRLDLNASDATRIASGQALDQPQAAGLGLTRLYGPRSEFLGVADAGECGRVIAKRLMERAGSRATQRMVEKT
jgi:tRNA pseudouridine55 synthase